MVRHGQQLAYDFGKEGNMEKYNMMYPYEYDIKQALIHEVKSKKQF